MDGSKARKQGPLRVRQRGGAADCHRIEGEKEGGKQLEIIQAGCRVRASVGKGGSARKKNWGPGAELIKWEGGAWWGSRKVKGKGII